MIDIVNMFGSILSQIMNKKSDDLGIKQDLLDRRIEYYRFFQVLADNLESTCDGIIYNFGSEIESPIVPVSSYFKDLTDNIYLNKFLINDDSEPELGGSIRFKSVINHDAFNDNIFWFRSEGQVFEFIFFENGVDISSFISVYAELLSALRDYDRSAKVVEDSVSKYEYMLFDNDNFNHYGLDHYHKDVYDIRKSSAEISGRENVVVVAKNLKSLFNTLSDNKVNSKLKNEIRIK